VKYHEVVFFLQTKYGIQPFSFDAGEAPALPVLVQKKKVLKRQKHNKVTKSNNHSKTYIYDKKTK